jgi:hypothetical protein
MKSEEFRGYHLGHSLLYGNVTVRKAEGEKVMGVALRKLNGTYSIKFYDSDNGGFMIDLATKCKWEAVALIISLHGTDRNLLEEHYG